MSADAGRKKMAAVGSYDTVLPFHTNGMHFEALDPSPPRLTKRSSRS